MTGVWIALAIGAILIGWDWLLSTPLDPRTKRRQRLSAGDRRRLRGMLWWTLGLALAVWAVPKLFY